jgi:hypothetical protein
VTNPIVGGMFKDYLEQIAAPEDGEELDWK